MDEKQATKILLRNLKGAKNKPTSLTEVAEACRKLRDLWGFDQMADFFTISTYMLRQIDKINDLNDYPKRLVEAGQLKIEQAYHLSRLSGKIQDEAAREVKNLTAHQTRSFVNLLKSGLSVKEAKEKLQKEYLGAYNLIVIPLSADTLKALQRLAKETKTTPHDLAVSILEEHLRG